MTKPDGIYPSTCWECSTRCGSLVTLENGHVARVGPNPDHPIKGAFCVKGIRALPELTYSPNRIARPMRRATARGAPASGTRFPGTKCSRKWRTVCWRYVRNTVLNL